MSEAGIPQAAAVYIYVDEEMNCYIASRESTRKTDNIKKNGVAVISGFDENILMFGELSCVAELITDGDKVAKILPELQKIILSRKAAYWVPPMAQLAGDGFVFFKLTPNKVTFMNYEKSSSENPQPHSVYFEM